jgi:hypothetical protein
MICSSAFRSLKKLSTAGPTLPMRKFLRIAIRLIVTGYRIIGGVVGLVWDLNKKQFVDMFFGKHQMESAV